ncbi:protein neprosin-like [Lolium perenne]|uniref:protein neprosin-like n=1 Tax=Lolium perenne TaxID=4522 RepID=UPI003A9998F2
MVGNYEYPHIDTLNIIQVGWNIQPSLYGDNKTHFLIGWSTDGYSSTGCFDLKCDGFVLAKHAPITPGDTLKGKSKMSFKIFKSKDNGDWWLHFAHAGQKFAPVGYWPQSLFNSLKFYSNYVSWGGYTTSYGEKRSPPMGNGHWPGPDSAAFQDMQYVNEDETTYRPGPVPGLQSWVTNKECYKVSDFMIDHFSYGGPGGCTN